jgi:predicted membrane channel-forming protein YqfA (hemolysin III family)
MSQQSPANRLSNLGGVILTLYFAGFLGIIAAVVSVTALDVPSSLKFVFAAIALMLAALCFAVGIFIDVDRP